MNGCRAQGGGRSATKQAIMDPGSHFDISPQFLRILPPVMPGSPAIFFARKELLEL
ncbi:MAG: hypothetical protein QHC67_10380 [Sphingobium sp.]|uniref:hypothetical protein n=1 Tax=Sphingobium sp. TaxID=1912891 RepID=UPI0029A1F84D|nr:hypothetical protein [Sphingobium sp.]MDX3910211.1 hypothetical protein [Sphingobium sp.]